MTGYSESKRNIAKGFHLISGHPWGIMCSFVLLCNDWNCKDFSFVDRGKNLHAIEVFRLQQIGKCAHLELSHSL